MTKRRVHVELGPLRRAVGPGPSRREKTGRGPREIWRWALQNLTDLRLIRAVGTGLWALLFRVAASGEPSSSVAPSTADPPEWVSGIATQYAARPMGPGIEYQPLVLTSPRLVRLHVFRVDLSEPSIELAAAITEDPDGEGPAEAVLRDPVRLAQGAGFWVAINANAFGLLETLPPDQKPVWKVDQPVRVCGWVVVDGVERCPPEKSYASFWVDGRRGAHCGEVPPTSSVQTAISGFGMLLRDGQIVPPPEKTLQPHPRSSVGVDAAGRVVLLVADGRQPGYSEGLTCRETAWVLWALGCQEAINLDGGGSTIALLRRPDGEYAPANRPSGRSALGQPEIRPVPVLLGVRSFSASPGSGLGSGHAK